MNDTLILDGDLIIDVDIDGEPDSVIVVGHEPIVQPISITENGHYEPGTGIDGFSKIDVNVKYQDLIDYINEITGGEDSTLEDAINTLVEGYGEHSKDIPITWDSTSNNKFIGANGVIGSSVEFHYSNLLEVNTGYYIYSFTTNNSAGRKTRIHGYDDSGQWVRQLTFKDTAQGSYTMLFSVTNDIKYVRISNLIPTVSESLSKVAS